MKPELMKPGLGKRIIGWGSLRSPQPVRGLALLLGLLLSFAAFAVDPLPFRDAAEEARFRALAAELRCVMCQNQSLADSDAPIAHDLRRQVLELMHEGRNNDEIKHFLTERYTDFVLYKPPMHGRTLLIWLGPVAVLLAGAVFVAMLVRKRARQFHKAAKATPDNNGDDW